MIPLVRKHWIVAACIAGLLAFEMAVFWQDAVPDEMLRRTLPLCVDTPNKDCGIAFAIDYAGKLYYVTAKHIVKTLPRCNQLAHLWYLERWNDVHVAKILFPPLGDADVAVLQTGLDAAQPYNIRMMEQPDEAVTVGQQIWFLAYPLWSVWKPHGTSNVLRRTGSRPPYITTLLFIKRGTVSAIDVGSTHAPLIYVGAFNNKGIAGGPIVYRDSKYHAYRIAGVLSGDEGDRFDTGPEGASNPPPSRSGIMIAYSIKAVQEAIDAANTQTCSSK